MALPWGAFERILNARPCIFKNLDGRKRRRFMRWSPSWTRITHNVLGSVRGQTSERSHHCCQETLCSDNAFLALSKSGQVPLLVRFTVWSSTIST